MLFKFKLSRKTILRSMRLFIITEQDCHNSWKILEINNWEKKLNRKRWERISLSFFFDEMKLRDFFPQFFNSSFRYLDIESNYFCIMFFFLDSNL